MVSGVTKSSRNIEAFCWKGKWCLAVLCQFFIVRMQRWDVFNGLLFSNTWKWKERSLKWLFLSQLYLTAKSISVMSLIEILMHNIAFQWRWTISVSILLAPCGPCVAQSTQLAISLPSVSSSQSTYRPMENDPDEQSITGLVGRNKQCCSKRLSLLTENGETPILLLHVPRAAASLLLKALPCEHAACYTEGHGMKQRPVISWLFLGKRHVIFLHGFPDCKLREPLVGLPVFKVCTFCKLV